MENIIDQNTLKQFFSYDNQTGFLIWRVNRGQKPMAGTAAGYVDRNGYLVVNLNYKRYYLHHLVYIYHYGALPPGKRIYFKDGNRHNPKIDNLYTKDIINICGNTTSRVNPIQAYNKYGSGNVRKNSPEYTEVSGHKEITWNKARKAWELKIQEEDELVDYGDFQHLEFAIRVLKHCQSSEAFLASHRAPVPEPKPKRNIFKEQRYEQFF